MIVAGPAGGADTQALLDAAFAPFAFDKVVIHVYPSVEAAMQASAHRPASQI